LRPDRQTISTLVSQNGPGIRAVLLSGKDVELMQLQDSEASVAGIMRTRSN
jgi:hypothetical protein